MCPIVPILTCGLLRSNFSFAIFNSSMGRRDAETQRKPLVCFSLRLCVSASKVFLLLRDLSLNLVDDLFGNTARHFLIPAEMHREAAASLCARAHVGRIPEHFR